MNRRDALIGLVALVSGCTIVVNPKILNPVFEDEPYKIQRVIDSYVILNTVLDYKVNQEVHQISQSGIGIVYGFRIITLDHISTVQPQKLVQLLEQHEAKSLSKIKEETSVRGIKLDSIVEDYEQDYSIFKTPNDFNHQSYPYELGNSDKIEYGQEILLIGNPRLKGWNVREGIVSSKVKKGPDERTSGFFISSYVEYGDSGSAVVDRRTFELLGLAAEKYNGLTLVRPINIFTPYLK